MAVERELINGVNMMLQGKEEGFNILYSHTYNYVYGRAKMIMKEEQDALDLTQETFIQAYRGIHTLENVNNIYAWLGGIVYRSGMKIFRKKRDVLLTEEAEGIFENIVSEDKDFRPEVTTEEKATSNIVMGMIEQLPELQKAAVLAFYYDNMKIDDIAELFECSSNTIKSRLNYAKKTLKELVEAHEKKYAYKLHSLSPAVLFLALRSLLSGEKYTMSAVAAQNVYNVACAGIGFAPTTIVAVGNAGATYTLSVIDAATTTASSTVAGATATAGTSATTATTTVASTATAAAATTATGMALGTKIAIGIAALAVVGSLATGGVMLANNGFFDNLFGEEVVEEDEDKDEEEEVVETEETEDVTEETEIQEEISANYAEIMSQTKISTYITNSVAEEESARNLAMSVLKGLGVDASYDMKEMTAGEKEFLNYQLLYQSGILVPTSEDTLDGVYGMVYDKDVLDTYLAAAYEGGNSVVTGRGLFDAIDDYIILNMADGDTWITYGSSVMYKNGEYVLIEMPCYEEGNAGYYGYVYTASVLLKYTGNEISPYQLVRVETCDTTPSVSSITASSQLVDQGNNSYSSNNLMDGNYATAWVENNPSVGIGESITIDFGSEQEVRELVIFNGYLSSYYAYNNNGKVTQIQIDCENGPSIVTDVDVYDYYSTSQTPIDMPVASRISLGETVTTSKITITILGAQSGAAYEDTCISEIEIH